MYIVLHDTGCKFSVPKGNRRMYENKGLLRTSEWGKGDGVNEVQILQKRKRNKRKAYDNSHALSFTASQIRTHHKIASAMEVIPYEPKH